MRPRRPDLAFSAAQDPRRGRRPARGSILPWMLAALATAPAASAGAQTVIFQDGFEECGIGRWSSSTVAPPPERFAGVTAPELAAALGACGPSLVAVEYRLADGSTPTATALAEIENQQAAVLDSFGTGGLLPRAGGSMAVLSSGRARDQDSPDWTDPNGGTSFARTGTAPAVYLAGHGGQLPENPVCGWTGNGTSANDSVALHLVLHVPAGARRLVFDYLFASANWPEWVCTSYDEFFLAIVNGSSPDLPPDRNLAWDRNGNPVSTGFVQPDFCAGGCPGGSLPLDGTGFGADAATDWLEASIPVVAGETLTLDLMVFDVGDTFWDTLVLLDGLRWERN